MAAAPALTEVKPPLRSITAESYQGRVKIAFLVTDPKGPYVTETLPEDPAKDGSAPSFPSDTPQKIVTVCGWSRTVRKQGGGAFCFVSLSDGSTIENLQVVVDQAIAGYDQLIKCGVGCSFRFEGTVVRSTYEGQLVEMHVKDPVKHKMKIYGMCDQSKYQLAKKKHGREHLREIAHLRPRTYVMGAVARLRNAMTSAIHQFYQDQGYLYVQTPLITTSDCEGAGEMMGVTTLLGSHDKADIPVLKESNKSKKDKKKEKKDKLEATDTAESTTDPSPNESPQAGEVTEVKRMEKIDFGKDFFHRPAFLTVSGQLNLENFCCGVGDVYTFGPAFRAEVSHTSRHLAEFWMCEPEIAFADLDDIQDNAEAMLKYCVGWALKNNLSDLMWLDKNVDGELLTRLRKVVDDKFTRISYTEAVAKLNECGVKFDAPCPQWGDDLSSEHEKYLCEVMFGGPVIVSNYPKAFKSFYMKENEDRQTVRAMDVLLPKIGEVIGGSQREDDLETLDRLIAEKGLDKESYWWYRELRQYGTIPHSGYGVGVDRLVMLVTGMDNIRDVIPFPRYVGHADF